MTKVTDLPRDLTEEVLSRVPLTSLRPIRFTCKKWNTLSKNHSFTEKQIGQAAKKKQVKEFDAIMTINGMVYLMSINLDKIHEDDNIDSSIKQKGKLISLPDLDRVVHSKVFHCSGLLLCILRDVSRLVVWNPYCGLTRWIKPRNSVPNLDNYALGYEIKNKGHRSHKILRCLDFYTKQGARIREFEIFNFESNSWRVVTPSTELESVRIPFYARGVSIKGNTYLLAREFIPPPEEEIPYAHENVNEEMPSFLLCFDFTTESFGPRLPLPFQPTYNDTISLSSVREDQLAVLYQRWDIRWTGIWISNKIEPNAVSWSELFLSTGNMKSLEATYASFFVDEEKKVVVVFDQGKCVYNPTRNIAYIFGEDEYNKQVDLGELERNYCFPLVCSYVPSSVQI